MKKQLEISAKIDTADFDRSISEMQRKLKDIYAPSDTVRMQAQMAGRLQSMGMGVSGPTSAAQERASLQYRKDLNTYLKDEFEKQEKISKLLVKRSELLDKLKERQQTFVKGSEKELEIKEKIARVEELQARKREEFRQRDENLRQAAEIKRSMQANPPLDFGGISGGRPQPSIGGISRVAGAIGTAATAIGIGGELVGNYLTAPQRTAGNLAGAVQGTIGQDLQNVYGRRSAFEAAFNPERARAAQMAQEANTARRIQAGTGAVSNILGYGAAGATTGAAGTALGGPLTSLGGGVLGGLGGLAFGTYKAFSDPAQRALLMSKLPVVGGRYGQEYESIMAQQLGTDYQKNLENLKMQNPGKTMASRYYEENFMRNLQAQRMLGIGNEQFYGQKGLLQQGVGAGFTPEMMLEMSQGIIGGGGSTRGAVGNAVFGNILSRQMDLTNSGQVLGTISGGVGGAEASKQATIKILAEGMRIGLDDSKFAEENRRFTQMTAEIISRSAATGGADFERVAGGFGKFVGGDVTVQGLGAAKTAYEQYQQITSSTTGPRGAMRAAGFLRDDKLSKLSTIEKQALMQIPEEQLNENNPLVAGLAEKAGITPAEFVQRVKNVNQGAVSRFKQADVIRDRLRARGVDVGRASDTNYMQSLTAQDRSDVTQLMAYQMTELGDLGQRGNIARAAGVVGTQRGAGITDQTVEGRLTRDRGRGEDVTVSESAKDFGIVLQNFRDFRKEIMPSAEAIANFTGKLREMLIALRNASENDIPNIIKFYTQTKAQTQIQSGKKTQ